MAERTALNRELFFTVMEETESAKLKICRYKLRVNAVFERTKAAMKEVLFPSSVSIHADSTFRKYL